LSLSRTASTTVSPSISSTTVSIIKLIRGFSMARALRQLHAENWLRLCTMTTSLANRVRSSAS